MVDVRAASIGDAPAVARVHHAARSAQYALAGVDIGPPPDPDDETVWHRALRAGAAIGVAERDGEVVGVVCADEPQHGGPPGAVELVALHVVPDHWGTGVAVRLHERYLAVLAGRPGVLDVWVRNERAIAFYVRHGWSFDGRERAGVDGSPFLGMGRPPNS